MRLNYYVCLYRGLVCASVIPRSKCVHITPNMESVCMLCTPILRVLCWSKEKTIVFVNYNLSWAFLVACELVAV